jgi:putative FmdB family regulatory protein
MPRIGRSGPTSRPKVHAERRYTRLAMPTYEYVCKQCGHLFEIVQSMRDDPLTECPECGGELRKVFAPPAISFKGSGFYATDHGKKATKPAGDKGDTGEKAAKGEPKKEAASENAKESTKDSTSGDSTAATTSPTPSGGKSSGTEGSGS